MKSQGLLFVLSGPSGVGKGSVCAKLLAQEKEMYFSVSDTTRPPRQGEVNGIDYSFITKEQFLTNVENDAYLEWARVYDSDICYGTPKAPVESNMRSGIDTLLEIDTQGASIIKKKMPQGVFIFLAPPNAATLEARLRGRKTESEASILKRLGKFREELSRIPMYDYVIVNEDLDRATEELRAIIIAEHQRYNDKIDYVKLFSEDEDYDG